MGPCFLDNATVFSDGMYAKVSRAYSTVKNS